jgi:hypothetical protein|tara:strand:- start:149 stop:406 length:258 start_codon:yes stop_codon:yes gene_type:complete
MNGKLQIGDYIRWLYPLGYVDAQRRNYTHGLITEIKYDDEIVDGQTLKIVETRTNKSFWLSTDLLISYGSAEVLRNGKWINPPGK